MSTEKKPKGPAPIAKRRTQLKITLPDDDLDVLRAFAEITGTPPATFIRQIVQASAPDLKALVEATREAQTGGLDRTRDKASAMLAKHIQTAAKIQQDMFDDGK